MTKLSSRKTRLSFVTNASARYRGKDRAIAVDAHPEFASVRLLGTRTRYEVSWRGVFDFAAEIYARRAREARQAARKQKRGAR